ncbi:LLM class flavin-dependent oxidoreductase [Niveispirillum irakense]|uniref:LLM class flavin-dependent oxidoreductase n=1 Tax=Niveispirillum irakense TaxID=34011 RepID=UPI000426F7D5|nr:LLM class flavin-dependent oxidoreductase [Niveispirillum irakense]
MYLSISIDVPDGDKNGFAGLVRQTDRIEKAKADFVILARELSKGRLAPGRVEAVVTLPWITGRLVTPVVAAAIPALHSVPFHIARALSAADFLSSGRAAWMPLLAGGERFDNAYGAGYRLASAEQPAKYADFIRATRALWDSWDQDALIINPGSGAYLDSAKVRRVDYRGPYFTTMGPLNAARPPQGYPLLLRDLDDLLHSGVAADVVLASPDRLAQADKGAVRLVKVTVETLDASLGLVRDGKADGLHLMGANALDMLESLRSWVVPPPYLGATARERLGLRRPINPHSQKGAA